jgi:hypothetical protein
MPYRRAATLPIMISDQIAGVLVAESRRWRFVAVDRRFAVLDGSRFGQAEAARQSAVRLARAAAQPRAEAGCGRREATPCRILLA